MKLFLLFAAFAASMLGATPAFAQSDNIPTYFCDADGFIRSDQTGETVRYANEADVPCPEAVLQGTTGNIAAFVPEQNRYVYVVVKSYGDYRGWGLDSYEWRTYYQDLYSRRYYAHHNSQRDFREGYRAHVRDPRPAYNNSGYMSGQPNYRQQYGGWSGGNNDGRHQRNQNNDPHYGYNDGGYRGNSNYDYHGSNYRNNNSSGNSSYGSGNYSQNSRVIYRHEFNNNDNRQTTIQRVQTRNDQSSGYHQSGSSNDNHYIPPRQVYQPPVRQSGSTVIHNSQSGHGSYQSQRRR